MCQRPRLDRCAALFAVPVSEPVDLAVGVDVGGRGRSAWAKRKHMPEYSAA